MDAVAKIPADEPEESGGIQRANMAQMVKNNGQRRDAPQSMNTRKQLAFLDDRRFESICAHPTTFQ